MCIRDRFKRTKARQLLQLVDRFRSSYEGRPVSEVLAAVLSESGYERALRTDCLLYTSRS